MSKTWTMLPIPEVSDIDIAFGASALNWMPKREDIPEEFKFMRGKSEWNEIAAAWFFKGLPSTVEFVPKEGVDSQKALRVIQATLGSFAPKHEHKEEAVAYMLASWFKKVKGWKS